MFIFRSLILSLYGYYLLNVSIPLSAVKHSVGKDYLYLSFLCR